MNRALGAAEMRAVDRASAEHGVPGAVLMETAGLALGRAALGLASPGGTFFVLCGPGNNGGDGLVAARLLASAGRRVKVELVGDPARLTGDPARNWVALESTGVRPAPLPAGEQVREGDVIVDALLGTGLSRAPQGALAEAIGRIARWRSAGAKVLSADLPSGLDSDTGEALEPCVSADLTLAFGFFKRGQVGEPGATRCGRLELVDIGIPPAAHGELDGPGTWVLDEAGVRARLPARRAEGHKGTYGHALVVAGSPGKTGAAALAGLGALRGGAGLVTVATRPGSLGPVLQHAAELMGHPLPGEGPLGHADLPALLQAAQGKEALVIGPGLDRGEETGDLVGALLGAVAAPCVLDADGLNALGQRLVLLSRAQGPLIVTPHPGELARLTGRSVAEVQRDRLGAARSLARETRAVVVLKGARTVIAGPDGVAFINPTGNPGMATGGTGDVLAGLCGALLAQGLTALDAALVGVFAHGAAGDRAVRRTGQLGLVASDLLGGLGEVWAAWGR